MAAKDLTPRQLKRLGRIDEKNPARAERVADRMNTRDSREARGKAVASRSEGLNNKLISVLAKGTKAEAASYFSKQKPKQIGRDTPLAATPEPKFIMGKMEGFKK